LTTAVLSCMTRSTRPLTGAEMSKREVSAFPDECCRVRVRAAPASCTSKSAICMANWAAFISSWVCRSLAWRSA
jgi:hypothetical protein